MAAIEAIRDHIERENQRSELLGNFFYGHFILNIQTDLINTIIEIIESEIEFKDDWFQWRLFDAGRKTVVDHSVIKVENPGNLFDFLKGDFKIDFLNERNGFEA